MSNWFTLNLGDAMLATGELDRIRSLFLSEYRKAGAPGQMAVFIRHESEGRLHCEVNVYFSPASKAVAVAMEAIPCNKPSQDSLGLLAGNEESWRVLFTE